MRRALVAASCLVALAAGSARAQSASDLFFGPAPVGKAAGSVMVRLWAAGVIPENTHSSVDAIGGKVHVSASAAPVIDLSYFLTDNIALALIAGTTRHTIEARDTALGTVSVGHTWVLPPILTLQYHFLPHARLSPYVGVGLGATFFYSTKPSGSPVGQLALSNNVGPAIQAGVDYNITDRFFLNLDVKQLFVNTSASLNGGAIHAKVGLDPTVVGLGIGYRF